MQRAQITQVQTFEKDQKDQKDQLSSFRRAGCAAAGAWMAFFVTAFNIMRTELTPISRESACGAVRGDDRGR
jgi:hypothetical protein